jgi:4-amino-4-deoxy-L-arabinose transferase-like glycosyltransferase
VPFLVAAVILATSYGTGMALTAGGRIGVADGLLRRLTVFTIGYAAVALLTFALGLAHVFHRWPLRVVVIVGAVLLVPFLPSELRTLTAALRRLTRVDRWLLGSTAAILVFDTVLASAPPTSGDAIAYHLTAGKLWLEAGKIFPVWWNTNTFQPFSTEMHFALASAVHDGRSAMVVGAFLAAFSAACVFALARELFGHRAASIATLVWVAQGAFLWEATGGFIDLTLAAFVALAATHLLVFRRSHRVTNAAWAGLALGVAVGSKYHGLLFVLPFAALVVLWAPGPARRRGVALASFGALLAVGLPWYVHNWVVTGNPVYPLGSTILGGKYVDGGVRFDMEQTWAGYGLPGIWRLPIFPIEFLLHTGRYERGYSFSPALFVLPIIAVALAWRRTRWLALGIVVYLVVWWEWMHQVTRYLFPVLPFAAALSGLACVELWNRRHAARTVLVAIGIVAVVPLLAISGLFAWRIAPGALGTEPQGQFVQRLTGTYDALAWLDRKLPRQGRVLIGVRDLYWLDRPSVTFDNALFSYHQNTPDALRRMRDYDVRYLAFIGGSLPPQLEPIRKQLRFLARLDVPLVTSRTLGKVANTNLVVWAWCDARGNPCKRARA